MSKDIIIELTRDQGHDVKGARYGVPSVAAADRLYEAYKVISYTSGEPYDAPSTPKAAKASSRRPPPSAPRDPAPTTPVPVPVVNPEPTGAAV